MDEPDDSADHDVCPEDRAAAWAAAFMAFIGESLTPRKRRHLIAILQKQQDEWEKRCREWGCS